MMRFLTRIAVSDPDARRAAVGDLLAEEGFEAAVQEEEPTEMRPRGTRNYLLEPEGTCPLFCAHYDAYPGSCGANDNAAGVSILIALAGELRSKNIRACFALFDGEENGHSGAKLFEARRGEREFSAIVNLDMCGYGDTLTVYSHGSKKKPGALMLCDKDLLNRYHGRMVKYLPESDDRCFSARRQPVLSIAVMPEGDVGYLDALATYNDNLLGKPPEFGMILGQLEVVTTMHGAPRDGLKWIQPTAMRNVLDYLLDAASSQPPTRRFWL